jgi:hypothetical protein
MHINLTGDYVWHANKRVAKGGFRPLRKAQDSLSQMFYRAVYGLTVHYGPFRVLTPVTPITTCAVPLGYLDPAGLRACSKDVSPLCHAHPIPCSRRDNSVLGERLRRRASAKLC